MKLFKSTWFWVGVAGTLAVIIIFIVATSGKAKQVPANTDYGDSNLYLGTAVDPNAGSYNQMIAAMGGG